MNSLVDAGQSGPRDHVVRALESGTEEIAYCARFPVDPGVEFDPVHCKHQVQANIHADPTFRIVTFVVAHQVGVE
jgi:hypothetical protein